MGRVRRIVTVPATSRRLGLLILGLVVLASPLFGTGPTGAQSADLEEAVRGRLVVPVKGEREPVEGVTISVRAPDGGKEVGSDESDADGKWEITIPDAGAYEAVIDDKTLPKDVELRRKDRKVQAFTLRPGQTKSVLFPLGDDPRQVATFTDRAIALTVAGISFGLIIAISAIGLSLIFGTTGLTNFAHGEMVTFGALVAWFFNQTVGLALIPSALLAVVAGGLAGGLFDLAVWRPLRRRRAGLIAMMVVSIGLAILFRYIFQYQFGARTKPYNEYSIQTRIEFGPVSVVPRDLWIIGLSLVILLAVGLLLQFTKVGKAMRAVADNQDLAASSGIDVQRVILFVWVSGGALAAVGGVMLGLAEQVSWQGGFRLLLLMFAGVTLGGLGTAYGALVGSFIIGLMVQVSTLWISPELKTVPALVVLILILLVRPQGVLGRAERVG